MCFDTDNADVWLPTDADYVLATEQGVNHTSYML